MTYGQECPCYWLRLLGQFFCLFFGLIDRTNVHERVFRQVIPLAVTQLFKAANGVFQRSDLTRLAGKHFRDQKRLRQESLDAASAVYDQFVLLGQFINTKNRDDILEFAVSLQSRLNAASNVIVTITNVVRIENT